MALLLNHMNMDLILLMDLANHLSGDPLGVTMAQDTPSKEIQFRITLKENCVFIGSYQDCVSYMIGVRDARLASRS